MAVWAVGRRREALNELISTCGSIRGEQTDLLLADDIKRLIHRVTTETDHLDVLVHAAGVYSFGSVESTPLTMLDEAYRVLAAWAGVVRALPPR